MSDGLQQIGAGSTPSDVVWNKIARRVVIDGSSSYIVGLISTALEGQHFWDTSKNVRYVYDGSNLTLDGGRRIGFTQLGAASGLTGSGNHTMTFSSNVQDTDSFRTSSSLFTLPSWADGVYTVHFHVVSSVDLSGNVAAFISRNGGAETWGGTSALGDRITATAAPTLAGGDTLEFIISLGSGTHTFNYEAIATWVSP